MENRTYWRSNSSHSHQNIPEQHWNKDNQQQNSYASNWYGGQQQFISNQTSNSYESYYSNPNQAPYESSTEYFTYPQESTPDASTSTVTQATVSPAVTSRDPRTRRHNQAVSTPSSQLTHVDTSLPSRILEANSRPHGSSQIQLHSSPLGRNRPISNTNPKQFNTYISTHYSTNSTFSTNNSYSTQNRKFGNTSHNFNNRLHANRGRLQGLAGCDNSDMLASSVSSYTTASPEKSENVGSDQYSTIKVRKSFVPKVVPDKYEETSSLMLGKRTETSFVQHSQAGFNKSSQNKSVLPEDSNKLSFIKYRSQSAIEKPNEITDTVVPAEPKKTEVRQCSQVALGKSKQVDSIVLRTSKKSNFTKPRSQSAAEKSKDSGSVVINKPKEAIFAKQFSQAKVTTKSVPSSENEKSIDNLLKKFFTEKELNTKLDSVAKRSSKEVKTNQDDAKGKKEKEQIFFKEVSDNTCDLNKSKKETEEKSESRPKTRLLLKDCIDEKEKVHNSELLKKSNTSPDTFSKDKSNTSFKKVESKVRFRRQNKSKPKGFKKSIEEILSAMEEDDNEANDTKLKDRQTNNSSLVKNSAANDSSKDFTIGKTKSLSSNSLDDMPLAQLFECADLSKVSDSLENSQNSNSVLSKDNPIGIVPMENSKSKNKPISNSRDLTKNQSQHQKNLRKKSPLTKEKKKNLPSKSEKLSAIEKINKNSENLIVLNDKFCSKDNSVKITDNVTVTISLAEKLLAENVNSVTDLELITIKDKTSSTKTDFMSSKFHDTKIKSHVVCENKLKAKSRAKKTSKLSKARKTFLSNNRLSNKLPSQTISSPNLKKKGRANLEILNNSTGSNEILGEREDLEMVSKPNAIAVSNGISALEIQNTANDTEVLNNKDISKDLFQANNFNLLNSTEISDFNKPNETINNTDTLINSDKICGNILETTDSSLMENSIDNLAVSKQMDSSVVSIRINNSVSEEIDNPVLINEINKSHAIKDSFKHGLIESAHVDFKTDSVHLDIKTDDSDQIDKGSAAVIDKTSESVNHTREDELVSVPETFDSIVINKIDDSVLCEEINDYQIISEFHDSTVQGKFSIEVDDVAEPKKSDVSEISDKISIECREETNFILNTDLEISTNMQIENEQDSLPLLNLSENMLMLDQTNDLQILDKMNNLCTFDQANDLHVLNEANDSLTMAETTDSEMLNKINSLHSNDSLISTDHAILLKETVCNSLLSKDNGYVTLNETENITQKSSIFETAELYVKSSESETLNCEVVPKGETLNNSTEPRPNTSSFQSQKSKKTFKRASQADFKQKGTAKKSFPSSNSSLTEIKDSMQHNKERVLSKYNLMKKRVYKEFADLKRQYVSDNDSSDENQFVKAPNLSKNTALKSFRPHLLSTSRKSFGNRLKSNGLKSFPAAKKSFVRPRKFYIPLTKSVTNNRAFKSAVPLQNNIEEPRTSMTLQHLHSSEARIENNQNSPGNKQEVSDSIPVESNSEHVHSYGSEPEIVFDAAEMDQDSDVEIIEHASFSKSSSPLKDIVIFKSKCSCTADPVPSNSFDEVFQDDCQGKDSIDGEVVSCTKTVSEHDLLSTSSSLPYLKYCNVHSWRLKHHHCCPECGLFCTQGTFKMCLNQVPGDDEKPCHLFHKDCFNILDPGLPPGCPHCSRFSDFKVVTLEDRTIDIANEKSADLPTDTINITSELESCRILLKESNPEISENPHSDESVYVPSKKEVQSMIMTLAKDRTLHLKASGKCLYVPIKIGDAEKVLQMIAIGVNPNQKFEMYNNNTPLHVACSHGFKDIVHILIQSGALVDAVNDDLYTPLMIAVNKGLFSIVRHLIRSGAQIDVKGDDGMTCFHLAAKNGHMKIAQFFYDTGVVNINAQDAGGWTPLVWACEHKHIDMVMWLLGIQADANIRDNEENIALHWATYSGETDTVKALLDHGCSVNVMNKLGDTPIHIAARQDHYKCVKLLAQRGANLDKRNKENLSSIMCCPGEFTRSYRTLTSLKSKTNSDLKQLSPEESIVIRDISRGKEVYPVQAINEIDEEEFIMDFRYVQQNCCSTFLDINITVGKMKICYCQDNCSSSMCKCSSQSQQCWYDVDGLLISDFNMFDPPPIYECNKTCHCPKTCINRVVQHGLRYPLQLFRTCGKGWGVRTTKFIRKGAFVCEYVGEVITNAIANERENDTYLFDLGSSEDSYCLDTQFYGNVARFLNHSCDPNLIALKVFVEHQDLNFPRIAFFAVKDIKPYEELCFDYGINFWIVKCRYQLCICGSENCKYSKDSIDDTLQLYALQNMDS